MPTREPIYLIVNADDYGYYPSISRGIVEAASTGAITATGILANSPGLPEQLAWLDAVKHLDIGVHLNLTYGRPLTPDITRKLAKYAGYFPSVYAMNLMLITGQISREEVRKEWRAQIEACQHRKPVFLNSHEHIHMLPGLFSLAIVLAKEFGIAHVRLTRAEWSAPWAMKTFSRNALIQAMYTLNYCRLNRPTPIFLGLGQSGKLDLIYAEKILSTLRPGKRYELMCHPGRFNADEISDDRLIGYHDWEGELNFLQSPELLALYERFAICLSYYRDNH